VRAKQLIKYEEINKNINLVIAQVLQSKALVRILNKEDPKIMQQFKSKEPCASIWAY
jgi:hypothetical protein